MNEIMKMIEQKVDALVDARADMQREIDKLEQAQAILNGGAVTTTASHALNTTATSFEPEPVSEDPVQAIHQVLVDAEEPLSRTNIANRTGIEPRRITQLMARHRKAMGWHKKGERQSTRWSTRRRS